MEHILNSKNALGQDIALERKAAMLDGRDPVRFPKRPRLPKRDMPHPDDTGYGVWAVPENDLPAVPSNSRVLYSEETGWYLMIQNDPLPRIPFRGEWVEPNACLSRHA